ncbi:MAG: BON domain-containing protein [Lapillicoccus sp.]
MSQSLPHTDHQLKASITRALEWAPEVDSDRIGVSVTQGAVTLAGEVLTYPEKTAAITTVLGVHGVTGLADQIVVKHGWGSRPDVDVARDLTAALTASVVVPAGAVQATVQDNWVTLTGEVAWNYQREAAAQVVGGISGVTGVHNRVAITPVLTFAAVEAQAHVRSALMRNALTDARTITVTSSGTELELSGTVRSWHEFREAGDAAWATPGVTLVTNNLVVVA